MGRGEETYKDTTRLMMPMRLLKMTTFTMRTMMTKAETQMLNQRVTISLRIWRTTTTLYLNSTIMRLKVSMISFKANSLWREELKSTENWSKRQDFKLT